MAGTYISGSSALILRSSEAASRRRLQRALAPPSRRSLRDLLRMRMEVNKTEITDTRPGMTWRVLGRTECED
jgi:hypothetical protein